MDLKIPKSAGVLIALMFTPLILWGSIEASSYVTNRDIRNAFTNTTCLLLIYTVLKHTCEDRIQSRGTNPNEYTCFDETFHVSYPIFNRTQITSIFHSARKKKAHQQTQIGQNYTCYYKTSDITVFIWELPNAKTHLIRMCVAFGLLILSPLLVPALLYLFKIKISCDCSCRSTLGVPLTLFVLALLCLFTTKFSCDCSSRSIFGAFIKKRSNNVKEKMNVESTNKIELNNMNTSHL
ncbi:unnamed protein product [Rotaria socialis]|uniref:Uncharacterized protein n=2 Tax=Rotaria socialis TaxID=392032 RepID=A0A820DJ91_9BILA|nr:unnamed protein product [Rotaria socialis]CAF3342313.1 unnamed protein product [Rotaria socialis]CAF4184796.1 unnamed protein product [Rotaria socialis]CAF4232748.1 unnamed protein product [Rotaria socialis]